MDRDGFSTFANKSTGIDLKVSNEIFSCATNCFSMDDDEELPGTSHNLIVLMVM